MRVIRVLPATLHTPTGDASAPKRLTPLRSVESMSPETATALQAGTVNRWILQIIATWISYKMDPVKGGTGGPGSPLIMLLTRITPPA